MIHISILARDGKYSKVTVKGHAEMDEYGKDLVCAGVSTVMFGLCNALDLEKGAEDIAVTDNRIRIDGIHTDEKTQAMLRLAEVQLETLREAYSDYVNIEKKTEVVKP